MKVGFIGAGKVGYTLGKYLCENGIKVTGYYSKSDDSAKGASNFTNSKQYSNLKNLINDSDTIFITTPDSSISFVWNEIKKFSIQNKLICHCSGSLSSNIFSDINKYGAYGYSIHPMFPISNRFNSYKKFHEAFITIEGNISRIDQVYDLFSDLGNNVILLNNEKKDKYHLANVLVSNCILAIINIASDYLNEYGFSNDEAINALYPLIVTNINNIMDSGIINSLTGPVERNDIDTIIKHCNSINKEHLESYKGLSREILKIAELKNGNMDYIQIKKVLGESL